MRHCVAFDSLGGWKRMEAVNPLCEVCGLSAGQLVNCRSTGWNGNEPGRASRPSRVYKYWYVRTVSVTQRWRSVAQLKSNSKCSLYLTLIGNYITVFQMQIFTVDRCHYTCCLAAVPSSPSQCDRNLLMSCDIFLDSVAIPIAPSWIYPTENNRFRFHRRWTHYSFMWISC